MRVSCAEHKESPVDAWMSQDFKMVTMACSLCHTTLITFLVDKFFSDDELLLLIGDHSNIPGVCVGLNLNGN